MNRVIIFLLTFAVLLARSWARVQRPDLWAEDGPVFLCEALVQGAHSLLSPFAGSFHTLQRLIALFWASAFPILWVPAAFHLTYLVIFAAALSTLGDKRFSWMLPSRGTQALTAFLICVAPGQWEMMGNLSNLNWILFLWLGLIGLQDPKKGLRGWEVALAFPILLSIGTSLLLLPLFLWRLNFNRKTSRRIPEAIICVAIVVWNLVLLLFREPAAKLDLLPISAAIPALSNHAFQSLFIQPWLGDWPTIHLSERKGLFLAIGISAMLTCGGWLWRRRREKKIQALCCLVFAVLCWPALVWIARPGSLALFQIPLKQFWSGYWRFRYAFPVGAVAVLFWVVLTCRERLFNRWIPTVPVIFALIYFFSALYRFRVLPYSEIIAWPKVAPTLARSIRTGNPPEIWVPHQPEGWGFKYEYGNPEASCLTEKTKR